MQRKKIGTKPVEVDDLYREEEWEGNVEEGKISLGIKSLLRHQITVEASRATRYHRPSRPRASE